MLTHGSLFAGIGGFDLGFDRAGIETVWTVEKDKSCNQVLATHWPNVRRHTDVKEVGRHNLSPVDIISGGFPCQDLSVAGRREGLAGDRSGLWFEFARIVGEMAPQWVVVENVPGLFSSEQGEDFLVIVEALDELRYGVSWRVFDSQYFAVAQRRPRVFVVGSLGDASSVEVLFESEGSSGDSAKGKEEGKRLATDVAASIRSGSAGHRGWINDVEQGLVAAPVKASTPSRRNAGSWPITGELIVFNWQSGGDVRLGISDSLVSALHSSQTPAIAATLNSGGNEGGFRTEPGEHLVTRTLSSTAPEEGGPGDRIPITQDRLGVRRLTPTECERLQGFPDGWTEGLSDSARYRCLGNAVTVNVAEWIGRRLVSEG